MNILKYEKLTFSFWIFQILKRSSRLCEVDIVCYSSIAVKEGNQAVKYWNLNNKSLKFKFKCWILVVCLVIWKNNLEGHSSAFFFVISNERQVEQPKNL